MTDADLILLYVPPDARPDGWKEWRQDSDNRYWIGPDENVQIGVERHERENTVEYHVEATWESNAYEIARGTLLSRIVVMNRIEAAVVIVGLMHCATNVEQAYLEYNGLPTR